MRTAYKFICRLLLCLLVLMHWAIGLCLLWLAWELRVLNEPALVIASILTGLCTLLCAWAYTW